MNRDTGGKVEQSSSREDGQFTVSISTESELYKLVFLLNR